MSPKVFIKGALASLSMEFNAQETKGSLGDPTGINKYSNISSQSLESWKSVFNTPLRKYFALRMLKKINEKDLEGMGYDRNIIKKEVKRTKSKINLSFLPDSLDYFNNFLTRKFKLNLVFSDAFSWVKKKFIS